MTISTLDGSKPGDVENRCAFVNRLSRRDPEVGVRWLTVVMLVAIASACGPNAAPITHEAQGTPTAVQWKLEPTPTAVGQTPTAAPIAPLGRPPGPPTPPPAPTPTGGLRVVPTVVPPPFGATATPARATLPAQPGGQPLPPVPTVGPGSPPMAAPPTPGPVQCQFADRTVSVPQFSTPVAPTGLTAFAVGDPLPGLHLELRLPRTTFVAGALIQPDVAVRNTGASDATLVVNVSVMPQNRPADPRSFPIGFPGPGPAPPPLRVAPGETQSISSLVQVPFAGAQAVQVHAVVRASGSTITADVPLKLTTAGPAQQLKIELRADRQQWCARATDTNGRTAPGPLLMVMTGRAVNTSQQTTMYAQSPNVSTNSDGVAGGRLSSNIPADGSMTVSVFVGGENYETTKAETTISL